MRDIETLPERVNDANPPDHRANAPAWIAFSLGLAGLLILGVTYIGVYGMPDQSIGGGAGSQQHASSAAPPTAPTAPATQNGARETTGSGAPAAPKQ